MLCILIITLNSCTAQKKEKNMEKYDFTWMEQIKASGNLSIVVSRGDTLIYISPIDEHGAYSKEYPPAPSFRMVYKAYYPTGQLKLHEEYVANMPVGILKYYKEDGTLDRTVDNDARFGEIKPDWILRFLEAEKWINLETGEGREEIAYTKGGEGYIKNAIFWLGFMEPDHSGNDYPHSCWHVVIDATAETIYFETTYFIHGDTGEVLSKETKKVLYAE